MLQPLSNCVFADKIFDRPRSDQTAATAIGLSMVVVRFVVAVVGGQQISTPVVAEITPNRVDVIGIVLGVVVLDDKSGRCDRIVMPKPFALWSGPSKSGPGEFVSLDPPPLRLGNRIAGSIHVVLSEPSQTGALFAIELIVADAVRGHSGFDRTVIEGEDVGRRHRVDDRYFFLVVAKRSEQRVGPSLLPSQGCDGRFLGHA